MTSGLLNAILGLVVGLATGYYFERRATKKARAHAASLETQLRMLRESVYAVAGAPAQRSRPPRRDAPLTEDELLHWLVERQNGAGVVERHRLFDHFIKQGYRVEEILTPIEQLAEQQQIRISDEKIEVISE